MQRNAATLLVRHRLVCLGRVSAPRQYFRTTSLILFRSDTITSITFRQCFSTLFIGIFAVLSAGIFRGTAFCLLIFLILRGRTRSQNRGCRTLGAGSRFALRCSRTSSHWRRFSSAFLTAASKGGEDTAQQIVGIALLCTSSCRGGIFRLLLEVFKHILDMRPAANQNQICRSASIPGITAD